MLPRAVDGPGIHPRGQGTATLLRDIPEMFLPACYKLKETQYVTVIERDYASLSQPAMGSWQLAAI